MPRINLEFSEDVAKQKGLGEIPVMSKGHAGDDCPRVLEVALLNQCSALVRRDP